jgi:uncharacterized protein
MQYRTFGRLDWRPSALGFGAMRLPLLEGPGGRPDHSRIDYHDATEMLRYAVDHGANYVDTAYVYHEGQSEVWLAEALKDGYRDKVKVATKMPFWKAEKPADLDRLFAEQQERTQLESFDFYLLHSVDDDNWPKLLEVGALDWAARALADGRIGHLGFSFHGSDGLFPQVIGASDLWTFCQIQFNYMDEDAAPGTKGLRLAVERGLAVIVMEPVRGGMLARRPPEAVAALWAAANEARAARGEPPRTPVDWALQWVWEHPEVSLVLSGMSTLDQVRENVASAVHSGPGTLTADELAVYPKVRAAYRELASIPCTACKYCEPCPNGVEISEVFKIYNDAVIYGAAELSRMYYGWLDGKVESCTQCAECEPKCPQSIAIVDWLEKAQQFLAVTEK